MNFNFFIDFLHCLYIEEVEIASRTNNIERTAIMVFSEEFSNNISDNEMAEYNKRQAQRTARCVKILGKGVVKVVHRCDAAKENHHLDLSECQLTQVPDAIFLLMKNTSLQTCSLAGNLITKIPTKLAVSFSLITELNLSNNRISALPTEMANCSQLEKLDISSNSFVQLPSCLTQMPQLKSINARKNFLAEVEFETVAGSSLETLNLEENPLSKVSYEELSRVERVKVLLSPREQEDWEDLSI